MNPRSRPGIGGLDYSAAHTLQPMSPNGSTAIKHLFSYSQAHTTIQLPPRSRQE